MRRLIALGGLLAALALALPVAASAATPPQVASLKQVGGELPIFQVSSAIARPPTFSTNARQAVVAAELTPAMQSLHGREHPLIYEPYIWGQAPVHWFVTFAYRGHVVAEVDVSPTGRVENVWTGPLALATYARGHYGGLFDSWWIVVPASLLFLLPFLDPRRLGRLAHLDALVLLSFVASYALFNHAQLEPAVWLVYPPLLYLLGRMLWLGWRGGTRVSRSALPVGALALGLLLLVGARIALSIASHRVIDVGAASAIGAHRLATGHSLYYASAAHRDTYGPLVYLAYVPFQWLFPASATVGYEAAVKAAAICFDLVTIVGLVLLGRRLRRGNGGLRLGLLLGWAWAACPFTLLGLMVHTNDGLIAMLSVLSLLAFSSAPGRGALLGLATAAKFAPAALLPLYARGRDQGLKRALVCAAAFASVVVLAIGLFLPSGGIGEFYNHTLGFQLGRGDVFSPWGLHPALAPIKTALEVGAVLLAALVAFFPRDRVDRSLPQVCALAAAVTIAVQLPAIHWFYYYIVWFMPFALVALLAGQPSAKAAETVGAPEAIRLSDEPEPVLAGV